MKKCRYASVAALLLAVACSDSPTAPTPAAPPPAPPAPPPTFSLSGTVSSAAGGAIAGATVLIVDGPNAGRSMATASDGRYEFQGLTVAGFTVQVTAANYIGASRGITLISNISSNFSLLTVVPWTQGGIGNNVFTMPSYFARVRIVGIFTGSCQNFAVRIAGRLVVNEILGTCSIGIGPRYDGVHLTNGGGTTEIVIASGVSWSFTEQR